MIDRTVKFPQIGDVSSTQSYVLVGANGSGKSHLGAWIEKNNDKVLRISAQRALSIPDTINIINEEAAWKNIFYGNPTQTDKGYKWKWGKETSTLVMIMKVFYQVSFLGRLMNFEYLRICAIKGISPIDMRQ